MAAFVSYGRTEWTGPDGRVTRVAPVCWWSVACRHQLLLLDGYARRKDAEIAADWLEEKGIVELVNQMSFEQADDYIDTHEPEWILEVGQLLQW